MSLPGGASFLFVCVCQCPFTCSIADNVCVCVIHAELQSATLTTVQWVDNAAPQRLQHFGCCVTLPVAVTATTWSCRPSASPCMEHQTDEMGPGEGREGSEMIWRSRSLCVPGLLRWWTTLWMAVTAEPGGLTQGWLCQPARSTPSSRSDECKIDKGSLICADKGKTHWLPQQLLPVVLGKLN